MAPKLPRWQRSAGADPALRNAGLGVQFAATLAVFAALGHWADNRLGSGPWLLIVGVFAGFAGGLYSLVRHIPPTRSKAEARAQARPYDEAEDAADDSESSEDSREAPRP